MATFGPLEFSFQGSSWIIPIYGVPVGVFISELFLRTPLPLYLETFERCAYYVVNLIPYFFRMLFPPH